jgi:uncharacterized membrane protein
MRGEKVFLRMIANPIVRNAPSRGVRKMNKSQWIASAIAAAVSLPIVASAATPTPAVQPPKSEKCYGLVKAGQNDCQTMSNSCAGTAKVNNQKDAWVYLPVGVCSKLNGASLQAAK